MLLLAIPVAKINHQLLRQVEFRQHIPGCGDIGGVRLANGARVVIEAKNTSKINLPAGSLKRTRKP